MHSNITVSKTPETLCPACQSALDAATAMDGSDGPSEGDISVCVYCGEQLEFDEKLILHRISSTTVAELDSETLALMNNATLQIRKNMQLH